VHVCTPINLLRWEADKTPIAILQRVLSASVTVDQEVVSKIGKGILVFAAVAPGDTEKEADSLAAKVLKLKLWDDEAGGRVRSLSGIVASCCVAHGSDNRGSGKRMSRTSTAKSSVVRISKPVLSLTT
jgi:D-Tyr-tRNAtyr deacylase